jgi:protein phosphatase
MGGHAAGEIASQMTVDGIERLLVSEDLESPDLEGNVFGAFLGKVLEDVNQKVWQAGQDPEKQGMGTTCTLAVIRGDQLFLAHIGDSRAYLLRDGELHQVSTDHSWVEEAVAMGTLTREEARVHPNRNVITRAIGLDQQVKVDTCSMPLANGDLILLCSDGLNSMIPDEDILKTLQESSTDTVCANLIKAANDAGGHDNTSVVIAVVGEHAGVRMPITDPAAKDTLDIRPRPSLWGRARRFVFRRK